MKASDYIAKVELTNKGGDVVAAVGERCDRVDPNSLGWLAEQGLIELAEPAAAAAPAKKRAAAKGA